MGFLQINNSGKPNSAWVAAVDVEENYQRQGVATRLYATAKQELLKRGIKTLTGAMEGSGPLQIREKVFGPGNTKYLVGQEEVPLDEAVRIMDKDYGRLIAETHIASKKKDWGEWIGVDLDGTLAKETEKFDPLKIGEPVPAMVEKIKAAIEDGVEVKIFTARLADEKLRDQIKEKIKEYTKEHIGKELESTNEKDPGMRELWDDRAKRVIKDEGKFAAKSPSAASQYLREDEWKPGETAWFEYHCTESDDSADAKLWYHSHQKVTVVGREQADGWDWPGSTMRERGEAGAPRAYKVRFKDGYEWTAGEDELMTSRKGFYRPDPPKQGKYAALKEIPYHPTKAPGLLTFLAVYVPDGRYGRIDMIDVEPNSRRAGVGKKAVREFEDWVIAQGGKEVRGEAWRTQPHSGKLSGIMSPRECIV